MRRHTFEDMQRTDSEKTAIEDHSRLESRINGVDVAALHDAIDGIRTHPASGRYRLNALNRWLDGSHSRTTVNGCIGFDGEQHARTRPLVVESDLPAFFPGSDRGMDPLELLLAAVGSCLTRTLVWHASILGVHLDDIDVRVEGDIDLAGCLGVEDHASVGFQQIHADVILEADVSETALDSLLSIAMRLSPVCNTVGRSVPIEVDRIVAAKPEQSTSRPERTGVFE